MESQLLPWSLISYPAAESIGEEWSVERKGEGHIEEITEAARC